MMLAEATETCRRLITTVKAHVTNVHLLVHYGSVNLGVTCIWQPTNYDNALQ
jgi:hypothetical protein